jgi:hypothetical protein
MACLLARRAHKRARELVTKVLSEDNDVWSGLDRSNLSGYDCTRYLLPNEVLGASPHPHAHFPCSRHGSVAAMNHISKEIGDNRKVTHFIKALFINDLLGERGFFFVCFSRSSQLPSCLSRLFSHST